MENFFNLKNKPKKLELSVFTLFLFCLFSASMTAQPIFNNCIDLTLCGYGDAQNSQLPQCVGIVDIRASISSDCTPAEGLSIDYKIDLDNDGQYDLLGYSNNQGAVYPFPNPDNLPVSSFASAGPHADGNYAVGTHRIFWTAVDSCSNSNTCEYTFTIEDCKPPTAYCEIGVSTIPLQDTNSIVDIWASDFDLGSFDNCTEQGNLIFSFSVDKTDRSRRLVCADAGQNLSYTVYVWDEQDNYSSCIVGVLVECTPSTPGTIKTVDEDGEEIQGVQIGVRGASNEMMILNQPTPPLGISQIFNSINFLGPYHVRPLKATNPLNGVTTLDLVLISRHILGMTILDSPYKMIAADVNESGSITTFDLIHLRRLILFIDLNFEDNESWRFVNADYDFANPNNPFSNPFPESYLVDSLSNFPNLCFIGMKKGDVNNSSDPNSFTNKDTEDRNGSQPLVLQADNQLLKAGNNYAVHFTAKELKAALGFQFSMGYDPAAVAIERLEPANISGLSQENFNVDRAMISSSWNQALATDIENSPLFTLHFQAKKDGQLSDFFHLSADHLAAEAYAEASEDIVIHSLELQFAAASSQPKAAFALHANRPNPFREQTSISFMLPEAGEANLEVYDMKGRLVYQVADVYEAGYHEVALDKNELTGNGLYYYQLTTKNHSAGKTLVLID